MAVDSTNINKKLDPKNNINIVSYNMHKFNQEIIELKSLCMKTNSDVIFIQEHWLTDDLLRNFDYFKNCYYVNCASAMDSSNSLMIDRPFGGVGVLISKSLCCTFSKVSCIAATDRYIMIAIDQLLLINVYMPNCCSTADHDELLSILTRIQSDIDD